jgi:hypothetical protein
VTDVSWCGLAMAKHVVVGSRPRHSFADVRTLRRACAVDNTFVATAEHVDSCLGVEARALRVAVDSER